MFASCTDDDDACTPCSHSGLENRTAHTDQAAGGDTTHERYAKETVSPEKHFSELHHSNPMNFPNMVDVTVVSAGGDTITVVQAQPRALVASLRRAVADAGGAGDPDELCGLRVMFGDRVLRDGDTLHDVGLGNGGTVIATKVAALHLWVENAIEWRTIEAPVTGPLCENVEVLCIGRDRVIAFPRFPAWRRHRQRLPWIVEEETGPQDDIGPYTIQHFGAADMWVFGADESSSSHAPPDTEGAQAGGAFLGAKRVALPLSEDENIQYFHFSDGVATVLTADFLAGDQMPKQRTGLVQKFRLCGAADEDLAAVRFEPELELSAERALAFLCGLHARLGAQSVVNLIEESIARLIFLHSAEPVRIPRVFQFPGVRDPGREFTYQAAVNRFDPEAEQEEGLGLQSLAAHEYRHQAGRTRCGKMITKLGHWEGRGDRFEYRVCELAEDGPEGSELSSFQVDGHVNNGCQSLGEGVMLFASSRAGEDAFYSEMRLLDWRQRGVELRRIPLQIAPGFIEVEWPRGASTILQIVVLCV